MRLVVLLFFIGYSASLMGQQSWISFSPVKGGFSVEVPDSMQYSSQELKVPIGTILYHTYFFKDDREADNNLYQVQYFDYPEGTVNSDSTELVDLVLSENIRSAENSVKGELLYQHKETLSGYPGVLFKISFEDGDAAIKSKMFIRESRFYSISVAGARDKSLNQAVERFLDSFIFVDKGA